MLPFAERLAQAQAFSARPAGPDITNQKFKRGQRIRVADELPPYMAHFESGFEGIVEYTYGQKFGNLNDKDYCIVVLDPNGKPINRISWYEECQLTLIDSDVSSGLKIIEAFREILKNA